MPVRVLAGAIILLLATVVSPWLLLPFIILHALSWFAIELLVIAAAIDAYFGVAHMMPYYTLSAFVIVAAAEWIKPHLSFYSDS